MQKRKPAPKTFNFENIYGRFPPALFSIANPQEKDVPSGIFLLQHEPSAKYSFLFGKEERRALSETIPEYLQQQKFFFDMTLEISSRPNYIFSFHGLNKDFERGKGFLTIAPADYNKVNIYEIEKPGEAKHVISLTSALHQNLKFLKENSNEFF